MKQRILVAVVGIPLLLAVLCWAPDWATALLLAALSAERQNSACRCLRHGSIVPPGPPSGQGGISGRKRGN